jgi:hypothetical protein
MPLTMAGARKKTTRSQMPRIDGHDTGSQADAAKPLRKKEPLERAHHATMSDETYAEKTDTTSCLPLT